MPKYLTLALASGLAVAATAAQAQVNSASITATATVQAPINVSAVANLDFQNVFPGVSKAVAVGDPTAGRWSVTGQTSTPVTLTFTLPTNLVSAGNQLPIGTWTGNHNTAATPTGTSFTPSGTPTPATLSAGAVGELFVFIGATVTPAANQPGGVYQAGVTLTVVY